MTSYDYDLFVIGAGSGGVRASRIAAQLGARVAVAEDRYLGGTCVNVGCVPKKLMVTAAHYAEDFEDAAGFGWTVGAHTFDWERFIERKDAEITRLNGIYGNLLEQAGVTLIDGRARIVDPHTVEINGEHISAGHILVATGSWPSVPEFPGHEHTITSNEIFHLPEQPRRMLIVGGGYIAVEFAGILHGMGSQVTQIYRGDLFLRGFDIDVRTALRDAMLSKPIDLRFNLNVEFITKQDGGLKVVFTDGSEQEFDVVLMATGRKPLIEDLGLEEAGVVCTEHGAIHVDACSKTSVDSIHAIGDVTDRMNLTPVALHEGTCLAHTLFGDGPVSPGYDNVASAIFSQPPCASAGLTEEQAQKNHQVTLYRSSFRPMKNTLSGRDEKSMMKLIVDADTDKVLGFHMVGPEAGEIMQGFATAMKCGVTKQQLDATIGIHPTAAEEWVSMRTPVA